MPEIDRACPPASRNEKAPASPPGPRSSLRGCRVLELALDAQARHEVFIVAGDPERHAEDGALRTEGRGVGREAAQPGLGVDSLDTNVETANRGPVQVGRNLPEERVLQRRIERESIE